MSDEAYYLTEYDGSVCRENPDGPDVNLDEFEVVAELNRMRRALDWYADEKKWECRSIQMGDMITETITRIARDRGVTARSALHTEDAQAADEVEALRTALEKP